MVIFKTAAVISEESLEPLQRSFQGIADVALPGCVDVRGL